MAERRTWCNPELIRFRWASLYTVQNQSSFLFLITEKYDQPIFMRIKFMSTKDRRNVKQFFRDRDFSFRARSKTPENPEILGIEIWKSRKNPENLKIPGIGIGIWKPLKIPKKSRGQNLENPEIWDSGLIFSPGIFIPGIFAKSPGFEIFSGFLIFGIPWGFLSQGSGIFLVHVSQRYSNFRKIDE